MGERVSEAGDRVSGAAERLADSLSRQRFLRWLGGGGIALATGLGLDRSGAFAQVVACNAIKREIVLTGDQTIVGRIGCVPKGVFRTCNLSGTFQGACEKRIQPACDAATDCRPPHKCVALFSSAENLLEQCEVIGEGPAVGCAANEFLCQCVVRVRGGFTQGKLVCRCHCH